MYQSFASRALAPAVLRGALAVVFLYHGLPKVSADNGYGTNWMKPQAPPANADKPQQQQNDGMPGSVQVLVAWGEVIGGIAFVLGLLTRSAAVGIIILMAGAIATVHGKHGFGMQHQGFEYNFVLICIAVALLCIGPGVISLDNVIRQSSKGPAQY